MIMATLARKLKQKMDKEKSKSSLKRLHSDGAGTSSDDKCNDGKSTEKVQKLQAEIEDNSNTEKIQKPEDEQLEVDSSTNEEPKEAAEADQNGIQQWKLDRERSRINVLEADRVKIRQRMPEEAKQEIRKLEQQCKTNKPPTPANFKIFTNEVLLDLLRYNDRSTPQDATRKPDLAAAVCDSMVKGTPPRCPKCKNNMLRFSCGRKKYGKRYYWCPGFGTRDKYYGCGFKADREDITRLPWIAPK